MQARGTTNAERCNKSGKIAMNAHLSVGSHRHSSSSQNKDRDSRKFLSLQKQRSNDNKSLSVQKSGATNHGVHKATSERSKHQKIQGALRSCGNWSEHVSSSGKIYFYNNQSEVSQWEKPKDWNDGAAIDLKSKEKPKAVNQRSNSKNHRPSSHTASSKSHANADADKDYRSRKDFCDRDYRSKPASGDHDYRDIDYRDVSSRSGDGRENNRKSASFDKDYRSHNSSSYSSNSHSLSNKPSVENNSNGHSKQDNYVPSTGEFYDYSTWNTNSSSTDSKSVNGVPHSSENSQSSQHSVDAATGSTSESKNNNSAASEFVRQLSNALTQAASTSNNDVNKNDGNLKSVFQLLLNAAAKSQSEKSLPDSQESLKNNIENETTTGAPSAKRQCLDNAENVEKQAKEIDQSESTADNIPDSEPEFTSVEKFHSVFDPSSILHVQNWPAEHHEKQCRRLSDDFHRFVADHMSDLNVQLTHVRSQVRASEILSTLQEQRILYIRQQIKDLESSSTGSAPFT